MMIKECNDLIEAYAYVMNKGLVGEKDEIKCSNIVKQRKTD